MRKKILALVFAAYLIAGCSSGGNTSGASGGGLATVGGLLLSALLAPVDGISHDAFFNSCFDFEGTLVGVEPGLTTKTGTFTVSIENELNVSGGLFPTGVTFDRYTVNFTGSTGAPLLTPRVFLETISLIGAGASSTVTVILFDLGSTIPEIQTSDPSGAVRSYRVTVTFTGRSLDGQDISISAATTVEVGNFDRCA